MNQDAKLVERLLRHFCKRKKKKRDYCRCKNIDTFLCAGMYNETVKEFMSLYFDCAGDNLNINV